MLLLCRDTEGGGALMLIIEVVNYMYRKHDIIRESLLQQLRYNSHIANYVLHRCPTTGRLQPDDLLYNRIGIGGTIDMCSCTGQLL